VTAGPIGDSGSDLVFSGLGGVVGTSRWAGSGYRGTRRRLAGRWRLGEHRHAGRGSVTAAGLVARDGDLVRAGAGHEPDLLWAVRGGGGLGVVIALGAVDLAVPRDRNGSFEPQIVRTGQGPGRTRQPPISPAGPATGSQPRCLLTGTARAPCTDRREVPVKAPRSRQRAPPPGPRTTPMV